MNGEAVPPGSAPPNGDGVYQSPNMETDSDQLKRIFSLPDPAQVHTWTVDDTCAWLQHAGLEAFVEQFHTNGISGDILFDLTSSDLSEMGITTLGDKKRIMKAMNQLKHDVSLRTHSSIDIAVIGSSPLIEMNQVGQTVSVRPLDPLDVDSEQDLLLRAMSDAGRSCTYWFSYATPESFSHIMQLGCQVLHITGHTSADGTLLLEAGNGDAIAMTGPALAELFSAARGSSNGVGAGSPSVGGMGEASEAACKCVVLASCNSKSLATAFVNAGARHVIAVETDQRILDKAARKFAYALYHSLLQGQSVEGAFRHALWLVRHSSDIPKGALEAEKFVLLPEKGNHRAVLFGDLPKGAFVDRSVRLGPAILPSINFDHVVGREAPMWEVCRALKTSQRLVVIVGAPGVGKSALACAVGRFVWKRHWFSEGVHWLPLKGLKWVEGVAGTTLSVLGVGSDEGVRPLPFVNGKRLIIMDNGEELLRRCPIPFLAWVIDLLDRSPNVKILLTSRRLLKAGDLPPKSSVVPVHIHLRELPQPSAVQLLRQLAPSVSPAQAEKLAELCGNLPLVLRVIGRLLSSRQDLSVDDVTTRLLNETAGPRQLKGPLEEVVDDADGGLKSGGGVEEDEGEGDGSGSSCVEASLSFGIREYASTLAPSLDSLDPSLRSALCKLTIFVGYFTLEGASAVLGSAGYGVRDVERARGFLGALYESKLVEYEPMINSYFLHALIRVCLRRWGAVSPSTGKEGEETAKETADDGGNAVRGQLLTREEERLLRTRFVFYCAAILWKVSVFASKQPVLGAVTFDGYGVHHQQQQQQQPQQEGGLGGDEGSLSSSRQQSGGGRQNPLTAAWGPPPPPMPMGGSSAGDGSHRVPSRSDSTYVVPSEVRASAMRLLDRERPNLECALDIAGASPAFLALAQMGAPVFALRMHPMRRIEIFERALCMALLQRCDRGREQQQKQHQTQQTPSWWSAGGREDFPGGRGEYETELSDDPSNKVRDTEGEGHFLPMTPRPHLGPSLLEEAEVSSRELDSASVGEETHIVSGASCASSLPPLESLSVSPSATLAYFLRPQLTAESNSASGGENVKASEGASRFPSPPVSSRKDFLSSFDKACMNSERSLRMHLDRTCVGHDSLSASPSNPAFAHLPSGTVAAGDAFSQTQSDELQSYLLGYGTAFLRVNLCGMVPQYAGEAEMSYPHTSVGVSASDLEREASERVKQALTSRAHGSPALAALSIYSGVRANERVRGGAKSVQQAEGGEAVVEETQQQQAPPLPCLEFPEPVCSDESPDWANENENVSVLTTDVGTTATGTATASSRTPQPTASHIPRGVTPSASVIERDISATLETASSAPGSSTASVPETVALGPHSEPLKWLLMPPYESPWWTPQGAAKPQAIASMCLHLAQAYGEVGHSNHAAALAHVASQMAAEQETADVPKVPRLQSQIDGEHEAIQAQQQLARCAAAMQRAEGFFLEAQIARDSWRYDTAEAKFIAAIDEMESNRKMVIACHTTAHRLWTRLRAAVDSHAHRGTAAATVAKFRAASTFATAMGSFTILYVSQLASILFAAANFQWQARGDFERARTCFDCCLDLRLRFAPMSIETCQTLAAFGVACGNSGDLVTARDLLGRAVQLKKRVLGIHHLEVGVSYHELGAVRVQLKEISGAEHCFKKALTILVGHLPEHHPSVAETKHRLAQLYELQQRPSDAIPLFRNCITTFSCCGAKYTGQVCDLSLSLGCALLMMVEDALDGTGRPDATIMGALEGFAGSLFPSAGIATRPPTARECLKDQAGERVKEAVAALHDSLALRLSAACTNKDPLALASTRLFLGRALLAAEKAPEALTHLETAFSDFHRLMMWWKQTKAEEGKGKEGSALPGQEWYLRVRDDLCRAAYFAGLCIRMSSSGEPDGQTRPGACRDGAGGTPDWRSYFQSALEICEEARRDGSGSVCEAKDEGTAEAPPAPPAGHGGSGGSGNRRLPLEERQLRLLLQALQTPAHPAACS